MRLLAHKAGDLSSFFNKIDETEASNIESSLKDIPIDSHTNEDSKCRIRRYVRLEPTFCFSEKNNNSLRIRTSTKNTK